MPAAKGLGAGRGVIVVLCNFLIVGWFYSEVALQNQKTEGTVHTKHQELKQASNHASKRHQ